MGTYLGHYGTLYMQNVPNEYLHVGQQNGMHLLVNMKGKEKENWWERGVYIILRHGGSDQYGALVHDLIII